MKIGRFLSGILLLPVSSLLLSYESTAQTITSNQSGNWSNPQTWIGAVVPGRTDSVLISDGNIITVGDSASCAFLTVSAQLSETGVMLDGTGFLAIAGGARILAPTTGNAAYLDCSDGTVTIGGDVDLAGGNSANRHARLHIDNGSMAVAGSVQMNNNRARITFNGSGTLFLRGDLSQNGVLNPASGTVVFDGTQPQQMGGYTFTNLVIDNAAGVSLTANVTVNGTLTLSGGKIILGENNTVIGPAGVIDGGSVMSYVATDGSGVLSQSSTAGDTVLFPVGTLTSYNPFWLYPATDSDVFSVGVEDSVSPSSGRDPEYVQRTWRVTEAVPGGSGETGVMFQWNGTDEGPLFDHNLAVCWYNDGSTWQVQGLLGGVTGPGPFQAIATGLTSMGRFSVGNSGGLTSVGTAGVAGTYHLSRNYPNPFNPSTQIEFSVDTGGPAELTVYNLLGQPVASLFSGDAQPGRVYTVQFNGKNLGSGVYLYELRSNNRTATRRMILIK